MSALCCLSLSLTSRSRSFSPSYSSLAASERQNQKNSQAAAAMGGLDEDFQRSRWILLKSSLNLPVASLPMQKEKRTARNSLGLKLPSTPAARYIGVHTYISQVSHPRYTSGTTHSRNQNHTCAQTHRYVNNNHVFELSVIHVRIVSMSLSSCKCCQTTAHRLSI